MTPYATVTFALSAKAKCHGAAETERNKENRIVWFSSLILTLMSPLLSDANPAEPMIQAILLYPCMPNNADE